MLKPIVITGVGAVTALGVGVEEYWKNLSAGACGIRDIVGLDTSALPVHRAAQVSPTEFNPKDYMPNPLVLDLEPFGRYAYAAACQAVEQSGLDTHSDRVGVVMGTALHG